MWDALPLDPHRDYTKLMTDVSLYAALLGGLISFLSPCVLPLVPP